MTFLNSRQQRTLALVADTLIPALEPQHPHDDPRLFRLSADDLDLAPLLEEAIAEVSHPAAQAEFAQFMTALEIAPANLLRAGQWGSFSRADLAKRTAILRGWANSRLPRARKAFQAVKRMTAFLFYTLMPDDAPNPAWPPTGFPGPPGAQSEAPRRFDPLTITSDTTLSADVLVIGSGAGGGVVAGQLAQAGHDVLVMEKGGYYDEADFTGRELEGNQNLYEHRGALTTVDLSLAILAGSALGGGTLVNWNSSLRPPDYIREEWATEIGFTPALSEGYTASLEAVERRLNVSTAESTPNRQNAILEQGATALGYEVDAIPRNVEGCEDCGFCHFGCPFGAKQSTLVTYLQDAADCGARLVVNAHVDRVTHEAGAVTGAVATVNGHSVTVKAGVVVVAAGSIHTPAILQRSGLSNPNIGRNLRLHPVVPTFGVYEEAVRTWVGPPQTRLVDGFANLDGKGYGVRLEVSPGWPGLFSLALPWQSGRQHKSVMQQLSHVASNIVLVRDRFGGVVKTRRDGQPEVHYSLHPYDAKHLMRGLLEGLKIQRAAGAGYIIAPHNAFLTWQPGEDFDGFLQQVEAAGFKPNAHALFSAHQMSTARLGGSPEQGALKPTGETWEVRNLYVADGAALPNASGVNPMISIMGTAHYIAGHIANGRVSI